MQMQISNDFFFVPTEHSLPSCPSLSCGRVCRCVAVLARPSQLERGKMERCQREILTADTTECATVGEFVSGKVLERGPEVRCFVGALGPLPLAPVSRERQERSPYRPDWSGLRGIRLTPAQCFERGKESIGRPLHPDGGRRASPIEHSCTQPGTKASTGEASAVKLSCLPVPMTAVTRWCQPGPISCVCFLPSFRDEAR